MHGHMNVKRMAVPAAIFTELTRAYHGWVWGE